MNLITRAAGAVLAAAVVLCGAAPALADKAVMLEGHLAVTLSEDKTVSAGEVHVYSRSGSTVYRVILDETGRKLCSDLAGGEVEVFGVPSEKDGVRWVAVQKYHAILLGRVTVERKEEDAASVWLADEAGKAVCRLVPDEASRKLALKEGHTLRVRGAWEKKEKEVWLALRSYETAQRVTGNVEVVEDEEGRPLGVSLVVYTEDGDTTHALLLDPAGQDLMKNHAWKTVDAWVVGLSSTKNTSWKVYSFKVVPPPEQPFEPGDDPDDGEDDGFGED